MKIILSIILFIGYWFVIAIFIGVFAGYIIAEETATNLGMLLAIPLGFIATKKTINKIFKTSQPDVENKTEEITKEVKVEEKEEKQPEYSYVKPKGKKPSERYLEKLKAEGKSPTPEADKIKQQEIKKRVLKNIEEFKKEDTQKEKNSLNPDLTVKTEKNNQANSKNTKETETDLILPFVFETEILNKTQALIKFLHINDAPKSLEDLINLLINEGYLFNREKWDLADSEFYQLRKRLLQMPMPDKYSIQNLIEKLRMEQYTLFLSENYLKTVPAYQIGQFIKQTTEQFVKEGKPVEEFLDVINSHIPHEILTNDRNIAQYLKEMEKAVNPTKRQRIKGLDRVNHYWKYFVYDIQLKEIQDELNLIHTNVHILEVFKNWKNDENVAGFRFETIFIPLFFDIGFGENIIPKYIYPLIINPLANGLLTPIIK